VGEHEGVGGGEGIGVASAGLPPRRVEVQHGVASGLGVVGIAEVLDPSHHGARRQAPALAVALGLEIQHTGQGDSIARPTASMGEEVGGLGSTGALTGVGEVVTATDQASRGGTFILRGEGRRDVVCSLSGL
jgi:hypothetical protein